MRQKASEKPAKILPDIKYHGTLRTADDFRVGRKAKQESKASSRSLNQKKKKKKQVNAANATIMRLTSEDIGDCQ